MLRLFHRFLVGVLLLLLLSGPSFSYFTGFGVKTSGWRQSRSVSQEPPLPLVRPAEALQTSAMRLRATVKETKASTSKSKSKSKSPIANSTVLNDDSESNSSSSTSKVNRGSHAHTAISRARISAANKGKTPWNAGRQHSPETKALIAEKTRLAMARRKLQLATDLGLTLEQFEEKKEEVRKATRKAKLKGGLTDEGRQRISDSQKRRWEDPEYRAAYSLATRGKRNHTDATKAKLSIAIKEKWKTDEYRCERWDLIDLQCIPLCRRALHCVLSCIALYVLL
jgi:hypothetical protein